MSGLRRVTDQIAPRVLSVSTFLSGAILLFSGATPSAAGRLSLVARVLPIGVIEIAFKVPAVGRARMVQRLTRR
jgi:phosphatidylglycerol lysyltransferase